LNSPWPDEEQHSIELLLPMLHLITVLDLTIALDLTKSKDIQIFQIILKSFDFFQLQPICSIGSGLLNKEKELVTARYVSHIPHNLRKDSYRSFSISSKVSISDFEFIKRISNRANARVYLARKKATKEIYAINDLPKEDLKQKNEMKKILNERDILLNYHHNNIVHFYFFKK
jgi:hypothetical protein